MTSNRPVFTEADHPRDAKQQFAEKTHTRPERALPTMFEPLGGATTMAFSDSDDGYAGTVGEDYDGAEEIPDHSNDGGDWCPHSGGMSEDGSCPVYCREADDIMGIDAGERDDDEDNDD